MVENRYLVNGVFARILTKSHWNGRGRFLGDFMTMA